MKRIYKNTKGFTVVEALLILIFIALIALIGLYVYHNHNSKTAVKTVAATSNSSGVTLTQTYTDPTGFSFKYPASWKRVNVDNGDPEFAPTALTSQLGQGLLIVSTDTYSGTTQTYLNSQNSNTSGTTLALSNNTSMTINGNTANYGMGSNDGGNNYGVYEIFHDGKVAILSFLLSTPTVSGGSSGQNYATYSTVDSTIAKSTSFNN